MKQTINNTLKTGLLGNAVFSGAAALALFVAAKPLAAVVGLPDFRLIAAIGILLIPFALHLAAAARRPSVHRAEILYLSTMDGLWVLASGALIGTGFLPLWTTGFWIVSGVALVVADLMALQLIGLLRHERAMARQRIVNL